ncbi:MAG: L-histidine N(alpha)-methyltransferase, partial [Longimicrobiales bacterium]|nr:L-histidine N(alpha)-methyltransferase [Longimicrobiales bacterium]
ILLDAMAARGGGAYYPLDVSADFLGETAEALRDEYPSIDVHPVAGDLTDPLDPALDPPRPLLVAFLGSTIGNFHAPQAVEILAHVRERLKPGDHLLLGADLRPSAGKTVAELEAAYDDAAGVTADFNRNALRVLNRRAGTDFDPDSWAHLARYDAVEGRMEMHLVAERPLTIRVPGRGSVRFARGDSLRTEISCKYDRDSVAHLFSCARLRLMQWITDDRERYALAVGSPA